MGGSTQTTTSFFTLNDLVYYSTRCSTWVWADNSYYQVPTSTYGAQGTPSPTSEPCSRTGALPFMKDATHLWLFGGVDCSFNNYLGDLWMYTIDTNCTKCPAVEVDEITKTPISVYPVPNKGFFTIRSSLEITNIKIVDIYGQKIVELDPGKNNVDIFIGNPGLYLVFVTDQDGVQTKKIVVDR